MQGKDEAEAQVRLVLFKQAIERIEKQINDKLKGDGTLLKLLADLKENSVFRESILDTSKDSEQLNDLAQVGKEIIDELDKKIKEQNKNIAALFGTEFRKIKEYYLPLLPKEKENLAANNKSSQSMDHFTAGRDINASMHMHQPLPPAEKLPEMWNIPQRNKYFTGREELLKHITEYFNTEETKHLVLTAHGLGGIGKTQLTLEYVWQNYKAYKGVCWFNAESREQLITSYINLGQELNLFNDADRNVESETKTKKVKSWLEDPARAGWLLIYDSALKQDDINNLLPVKEGKILISSRHTHWPQFQTVAVGVFSLIDAQNYIKKIIAENKFNVEHANQLITLLDYLPLALAQACAYIQRRRVSIIEYIDLYKKKHGMLLNEQLLSEDQYAKSVSITWNITLDKMLKEAPESVELLYCCSHLHHEQIPESLVPYFFEEQDETELKRKAKQAISIASEYSMITIDEQKQTFSMHILTQQVIRDQLIKEKKDADYLLRGISALNNIYPYGPDKKHMTDYVLKRVLKFHLETVLSYLDDYLNKLNILDDEKAKQLFFNLQKDALLMMLIYLAETYGDLGDTKEQKILLERILPIMEAHYGKDHVKVAKKIRILANVYGGLGDTKEQKILLERALKIQKAHYGKEHVEVATTLESLAIAYGDLGDYNKKKILLERTLKICEAYYGKEHVEVAIILNNLANAYGDLGDAKEKKILLEQALKIFEKNYGKEHVEVARTLNNLANAYCALGRYNKQKMLLERALRIKEAHYGKEHVEVARTLVNLGNAYGALGDAKAQEVLCERALKIQELYYGKNHVDVAKNLNNLANAYGALGDVLKKKELLERALKIKEAHYGKEHVEVARALSNLATAYGALRDTKEQKVLLERALKIEEAHYAKKEKQKLDEINQKLSASKEEEHFSGSLFTGMFSKPPTNVNHGQLEKLISKYNLPDSSQLSLEKGLRMAATNNQAEDIDILIKAGININAQDGGTHKRTALHWAIIKNAKECIKKLLGNDALFDIKDASGKTVFDYAKETYDNEILSLFLIHQSKLQSLKR